MIAAKLFGAVIGLPFGVFGVLLGLIIGALLDQILLFRRGHQDVEGFLLQGSIAPHLKDFVKPASAVALSAKLAAIDQPMDRSLREFVISRISEHFRVKNSRSLYEFWILSMRYEARLNLPWLIRVYGLNDKEFRERDFLFDLFHTIAALDEKGISRNEYGLICEIFEPLGLGQREIQRQFRARPSLNRQYCELLELDPECSEQELKKRYREVISSLHPDSANDSIMNDEKRGEFAQIQTAYNELLWQFRYYDTR